MRLVNFPDLEREIGLKLLENYERATDSYGSGLPIGPMFSHLIGNLVLRDIDLKMNERQRADTLGMLMTLFSSHQKKKPKRLKLC